MNRVRCFPVALMFLSVVLLAPTAHAQGSGWIVGFKGGPNMWINDLNQRKVGVGGEVSIQYGFNKYFSLGLLGGYEELKSSQSPTLSFVPADYIKLQAIPVSVNGYLHLAPGYRANPYLYLGGGVMFYKRLDGAKQPVPANEDKMHTSVVVPVGVGVDIFATRKVAISLDASFRFLDDYTDTYKYRSPDSYAAVKGGLTFYLGSNDADDDDNDRLTNGEERRYGTDPNRADTDGDGLKDGEEVKRYRTNPLAIDSDSDGLPDGEEVFKYKTDPAKADTDEDGLSDGDEVMTYGTDPLKIDSDGDGLPDGEEVNKVHSDPHRVDTDGDGLSDWDEVRVYKTDPTAADTDSDGLPDGEEVRKYKTNPLVSDTDGGGISDGAEVKRGTNPLNPRDDIGGETIVLEKGKSVVLEGVNFLSGSATLTSESERTLEKAFHALVASPDISVEIVGYTDNVGSASTNERLSLRRAEAVKSWLLKKGIAARRLKTIGMGMRNPVASNATAEGRAKNRRIEFNVRK